MDHAKSYVSVRLIANGVLSQLAGGGEFTKWHIWDTKSIFFDEFDTVHTKRSILGPEKTAGGSCGARHLSFKDKDTFSQHGAWACGPDKPEG